MHQRCTADGWYRHRLGAPGRGSPPAGTGIQRAQQSACHVRHVRRPLVALLHPYPTQRSTHFCTLPPARAIAKAGSPNVPTKKGSPAAPFMLLIAACAICTCTDNQFELNFFVFGITCQQALHRGLRRDVAVQQLHHRGGNRHLHAHGLGALHHGAGAVHALGHVAQ